MQSGSCSAHQVPTPRVSMFDSLYPTCPSFSLYFTAWSMELLWRGIELIRPLALTVLPLGVSQGSAFLSLLKHWSQFHFLFGFSKSGSI